MEQVARKGLAKSIGVSNFNRRQIERVLEIASIPPVNNQVRRTKANLPRYFISLTKSQIECHPYLNQKKLMEFCASKNITITAYSPLGSPDRPWVKPGEPQLLDDDKLKQIAKKYKKTPAQIVLKYQVQRGNVTIPKSVTKSRIKENFEIFDFELSAHDVGYIDTFDCNGRICGALQ